MEVGARVFKHGRGLGIVALDNEDGTWNVEFDDDGAEGDFRAEDLVLVNSLSWAPAGAVVPYPWSQEKAEGHIRFVCFSDTHGMHDLIPREHRPPADVLLHAGDFTNTGEPEQVKSFGEWLSAYPAQEKIVIAGNHDITFHEQYYKTRGAARFHRGGAYDCHKARSSLTGCTYLEDSSVDVLGYKVYGSPWQPDFCDWAFNLPRGQEIRKKWEAIPDDTDILLVHGPPAGHGDRCRHGRVGCQDLLEVVQSRAISVVVAGHLHEDHGCTTDEVTLFVNASTCTSEYNPTHRPIVFDLPRREQLRPVTEAAALHREAQAPRKGKSP